MAKKTPNRPAADALNSVAGRSVDLVQSLAMLADAIEFMFLGEATARSKSYQVEFHGDEFRALLAVFKQAKEIRDDLTAGAKAAGIKPTKGGRMKK